MAPKMRTRTATDITIVTIVIISAIAIITTATGATTFRALSMAILFSADILS